MDDIKRVKPTPPRQPMPAKQPAPRVIGLPTTAPAKQPPPPPKVVSGGQDLGNSGSSKKHALFTVLIVLAIGLAVGGALAYFGSSKNDNKKPAASSQNQTQNKTEEQDSTQDAVKDTTRTDHINEIRQMLETYYNDNGRYPTLEQANDSASWSNYRGALDLSTVKDPDGTSSGLVGQAAAGVYHYIPTPAGDDFTLGATKSDGTLYEVQSANHR